MRDDPITTPTRPGRYDGYHDMLDLNLDIGFLGTVLLIVCLWVAGMAWIIAGWPACDAYLIPGATRAGYAAVWWR
jgi:hypothetical protein